MIAVADSHPAGVNCAAEALRVHKILCTRDEVRTTRYQRGLSSRNETIRPGRSKSESLAQLSIAPLQACIIRVTLFLVDSLARPG